MPTPALQIHLLTGPGAGRRMSFTESPITFGRDADNTLVIAESYASRRHGELRFTGGQWLLVNQSANGTRVGKASVTTKPRPLRDGDVVAIGDTPVFEVNLEAAPAGAAGPSAAPATGPAATSAATSPPRPGVAAPPRQDPRKRKVLINTLIIGGLAVGVFGIILSILFPQSCSVTPTQSSSLTYLSENDIEAEITKLPPLKPRPPADPSKTRTYLHSAEINFDRAKFDNDALYEVYNDYRQALINSDAPDFLSLTPNPDERKPYIGYEEVERRLVAVVKQTYAHARTEMEDQNFPEAARDFERVTRLYPDQQSRLYQNAQEWQLTASRSGGGKRQP